MLLLWLAESRSDDDVALRNTHVECEVAQKNTFLVLTRRSHHQHDVIVR